MLAPTSPTSGSSSVGVVRSRTQVAEFILLYIIIIIIIIIIIVIEEVKERINAWNKASMFLCIFLSERPEHTIYWSTIRPTVIQPCKAWVLKGNTVQRLMGLERKI
jgi:hypothetical protein